MRRQFVKSTILAGATLTAGVVMMLPSAHAQSARDLLEGLLNSFVGERGTALKQAVGNWNSSKSILTGRTWTFIDAGRATAKITAYAKELCVEKVGTKNLVCVDYSGNETRRKGYALMPAGTGESMRLLFDQGRIVAESELIECTIGSKVLWATSTALNSKDQATGFREVSSNGGLGGCS
jgi:hypothetical protein